MKRVDGFTLSVLFLLAIFIVLFIRGAPSTGHATESSTSSNVTITKYLSIALSANLSNGIEFGSIDTLPAVDVNATDNSNGGSNASSLYINVSTDSNTAVDFCIKANSDLLDSSSGAVIGLTNETYLNSSNSSSTLPGPSTSGVVLTTTYVKASAPTGRGNVTFYRLWLDVPAAIASGSYNNSIYFKGVETATDC